jgi:hypothetical protein
MGAGCHVSARRRPAARLTVAPDIFDRKVAVRVLSGDMKACHTAMAFANRNLREGLTFHSDRGARRLFGAGRENGAPRLGGAWAGRGAAGTTPARKLFSKRSNENWTRRGGGQAIGVHVS